MNVKLIRGEWRAFRRSSLRLMHHGLSLVGLGAVGVVALVATHPDSLHAVRGWLAPAVVTAPLAAAQPPSQNEPLVGAIVHPSGDASRLLGMALPDLAARGEPDVTMSRVSTNAAATTRPMNREQRDVTIYLSRKYRVNSDAIAMLVGAAYVTGKDLDLDPLLLLSVMGVESGFNPFAESTAGASGLMQLVSKVHREKLKEFGGPDIALNPIVNLRVGALVLKDCIRRGGSIMDGLRLYVGAGNGTDSGYGSRVLQEKDRLAQAIRDPGHVRIESAGSVSPGAASVAASAASPNGSSTASSAASSTAPSTISIDGGSGRAARSSGDGTAHQAVGDDRVESAPSERTDDPDHGRFARGDIASL